MRDMQLALRKISRAARSGSIVSCPHCGGRAISVSRKMFMGWKMAATCEQCHQKVGLPVYSAFLSGAMVIVAVVVTSLSISGVIKVVVWVAAILVAVLVQILFVPLEPR